jgi:acetyl-CoA carboxylase biotin carboxyl carrier protein
MSQIASTMTGTVFKVQVQQGDVVKNGDEVIILESMKMEIPIAASADGTVKEVKVDEGAFVNEGDVLIVLE